jgi:hypothetical protein
LLEKAGEISNKESYEVRLVLEKAGKIRLILDELSNLGCIAKPAKSNEQEYKKRKL